MEKIILIDGKEVGFKSTGAVPLRYKAQFGKDFFSDLMKLEKVANIKKLKAEDIASIDFDVFYNICWILAKTYDKTIALPIDWLDEFDSFPIIDVLPELTELLQASISTKKK